MPETPRHRDFGDFDVPAQGRGGRAELRQVTDKPEDDRAVAEFYFAALELLPNTVGKMATRLLDLDPSDPFTEAIPEEILAVCPVYGMPRETWLGIRDEIIAKYDFAKADDSDPFRPEPSTDVPTPDVGRDCAALLVRRLAEWATKYLKEEPRIRPPEAANLSPRQWEAVALLCNRRLELAEAGAIMGCEPGTVKRHFEEAAKALGMSVKDLRRRRLSTGVG